MKVIIQQIWCNRNYIAKRATAWTAGIYGFLGFVSTFASLSDILPDTLHIIWHIVISICALLLLWLLCFLINGIWHAHQRRFEVVSGNSGHKVYIQYGDIFSDEEVNNPTECRNIVIPVNRCFDTIVDNKLIAEKTLHGMHTFST